MFLRLPCQIAKILDRVAVPHPPGSVSRLPQLIQILTFGNGIHGLKESFVPVGTQFALRGQGFERTPFKDTRGSVEMPENIAMKYKKSGIDPGICLRLFFKTTHQAGLVELQDAKA